MRRGFRAPGTSDCSQAARLRNLVSQTDDDLHHWRLLLLLASFLEISLLQVSAGGDGSASRNLLLRRRHTRVVEETRLGDLVGGGRQARFIWEQRDVFLADGLEARRSGRWEVEATGSDADEDFGEAHRPATKGPPSPPERTTAITAPRWSGVTFSEGLQSPPSSRSADGFESTRVSWSHQLWWLDRSIDRSIDISIDRSIDR